MNSQGDNKISKLSYRTEDIIVLQEIYRELNGIWKSHAPNQKGKFRQYITNLAERKILLTLSNVVLKTHIGRRLYWRHIGKFTEVFLWWRKNYAAQSLVNLSDRASQRIKGTIQGEKC